jgi:hypothetical protein
VLPPLAEVAEAWGIKVSYRPARGGGYSRRAHSPPTAGMELVTHAEMTFFHELAHAAHGHRYTQRAPAGRRHLCACGRAETETPG